jgi:hypothetical protein
VNDAPLGSDGEGWDLTTSVMVVGFLAVFFFIGHRWWDTMMKRPGILRKFRRKIPKKVWD